MGVFIGHPLFRYEIGLNGEILWLMNVCDWKSLQIRFRMNRKIFTYTFITIFIYLVSCARQWGDPLILPGIKIKNTSVPSNIESEQNVPAAKKSVSMATLKKEEENNFLDENSDEYEEVDVLEIDDDLLDTRLLLEAEDMLNGFYGDPLNFVAIESGANIEDFELVDVKQGQVPFQSVLMMMMVLVLLAILVLVIVLAHVLLRSNGVKGRRDLGRSPSSFGSNLAFIQDNNGYSSQPPQWRHDPIFDMPCGYNVLRKDSIHHQYGVPPPDFSDQDLRPAARVVISSDCNA